MRRAFLLSAAVLMFAPNAAVAIPDDVAPGLVGPTHPLYEVDVLVDDTVSGVLKPPGEVAHERASEAFVAAEMNDTAGMGRALYELEQVANRTNGVESADGLSKAEQVLLDLRDRVPEQATFEIDTALESVIRAKNRVPTDRQPDETGPDTALDMATDLLG